MDVTPNDVRIAIDAKMPATCDELRRRLGLWIETAQNDDAARHIVQADGSMADDLFVLLQLVYVYLELAGLYAESTSNLMILAGARRHILRKLADALKEETKEETK